MTDVRAELIEPMEAMRDAYRDFLAEFDCAGEKEVFGAGPFKAAWGDGFSFADLVRRAREQAMGMKVREGYVPASTFWLVRDGRVLGTCNLRHRLSESLREWGGHIGYSVRPSERGKGYATLMLRLTLAKARERGIGRVLVTCDKDNPASARVIERNGGELVSEGVDPRHGKLVLRYWIDLGGGGPVR